MFVTLFYFFNTAFHAKVLCLYDNSYSHPNYKLLDSFSNKVDVKHEYKTNCDLNIQARKANTIQNKTINQKLNQKTILNSQSKC